MVELQTGVIELLYDDGGDRSQSVQALATPLPADPKGHLFRPLLPCRPAASSPGRLPQPARVRGTHGSV